LSGNKYSGQATADMIAGYYEFGVKDAKELITLAPPTSSIVFPLKQPSTMA